MREVSSRNFGYLIAYIIPGFVALWGISLASETAHGWLSGHTETGPTIGGFLYVTIASVGLGMTASAIRWLIVDGFHHLTGLARPAWTDEELHDRLAGYEWLIDNHYRYYQFYGNTLISTVFTLTVYANRGADDWSVLAGAIGLCSVFLASSRNALYRYYHRAESLLGKSQETDR